MDEKIISKITEKIASEQNLKLEIGKTYEVEKSFHVYWKEGHEAVSPWSGNSSSAVNLLTGNRVKILKIRGAHWYEAKLTHLIQLEDNGKKFTHQGEVLIPAMDVENLKEV